MPYLIFDFDGVLDETDIPRCKFIAKMHGQTKEEIIDLYECTHRFGYELIEHGFELFSGFID